MMRGETNPPGQHSREDWAKRVVGDLLSRNPSPFIHRGFVAILLWIVNMIVPTILLDYAFAQRSRLSELKKLTAEEKKPLKAE
jgi:hypothetical protein